MISECSFMNVIFSLNFAAIMAPGNEIISVLFPRVLLVTNDTRFNVSHSDSASKLVLAKHSFHYRDDRGPYFAHTNEKTKQKR